MVKVAAGRTNPDGGIISAAASWSAPALWRFRKDLLIFDEFERFSPTVTDTILTLSKAVLKPRTPHAPATLVARTNSAKRLECGGSPPLSKEAPL